MKAVGALLVPVCAPFVEADLDRGSGRGTDGKRNAPGPFGAQVDPAGPVMDVLANANPWEDLWFYANPIFVDVAGAVDSR